MLPTIRVCARRQCWTNFSAAIPAATPTACCARCSGGWRIGGRPRAGTGAHLSPGTSAGLQALSDFTDIGGLGVTLGGEPFPHLLYHFWLAFSGWQYVKAICGGESFTALTEGVQEALWQLGGVPRNIAPTGSRRRTATSPARRTRRCAMRSSAAITAWSRPVTTPASATRMARLRPRTVI